jgi:hypothetical protein
MIKASPITNPNEFLNAVRYNFRIMESGKNNIIPVPTAIAANIFTGNLKTSAILKSKDILIPSI